MIFKDNEDCLTFGSIKKDIKEHLSYLTIDKFFKYVLNIEKDHRLYERLAPE